MSNKNHVHVWEWNVPPEALDCMKCGEYLDCGNIVEHMNALESQLASTQARLAGYEWIPVGERLPKFDKSVLFFIPDAETVTQGYRWRTPLSWRWSTEEGALFEQSKVTHWMPLPEAPKEDE